MRPRMWSACSSMMRKNSRVSAGSNSGEAANTVVVEPLMEVSGARSSWLTKPKNSGPLAFQLLQRRQILYGDHHGLYGAVPGMDWSGVDQRREAPAVGDRQHDLLSSPRGSLA